MHKTWKQREVVTKKSFSLIACKLIIRKNLAEGAHIKEWDYYTPSGEFRVDGDGSPTLLNCMMYKMCYYRFGQVYTEGGML